MTTGDSHSVDPDIEGRGPGARRLEQVSQVSQIVGMLAVVVSLVYVGVQLRQATQQLQREENNATEQQWQAIRLLIAADRDVARLWTDGLNGDSLDAVDRVRFESLLSEHTWSTYHIWDRTRLGIFEDTEFDRGAGPPLARWVCTPGGGEWWSRSKSGFPPGFVDDMSRIIGRMEAEGALRCSGT